MLIYLAGLESHSYACAVLGCSSCKHAQTTVTSCLLGIGINTDMGTWSSACGTEIWITSTELRAALAMHLIAQPAK